LPKGLVLFSGEELDHLLNVVIHEIDAQHLAGVRSDVDNADVYGNADCDGGADARRWLSPAPESLANTG
jgi:hypothetical protein